MTPNREWVIRLVGPARIEGTENGELLLLTPELNVVESPESRYSDFRTLSFPLEVGKRWRYATEWLFKPKGSKGQSVGEVEVLAYEKVVVPAGEFDAFKLVATDRISGTSPINSQYAGEIVRTYWYAPAARAVVKIVTANPYLGPSTVELTGFRLEH